MREYVFQFKQFSVKNSISAMKVGTDGVLLGAWCNVASDEGHILDVGAGTGLISLMIAQRSKATIIGVEISSEAASEACYNVNESKWSNRITIINSDFKDYINNCGLVFNHVVSNPPYFENGVKSDQTERATARHTDCLGYEDLIIGAYGVLGDDGKLSMITPYDVKDRIIKIAESCGFKLSRITEVYPTLNSIAKRILWEFSKKKEKIIETSLVIESGRHIYTPEYINLTKDFYLKM